MSARSFVVGVLGGLVVLIAADANVSGAGGHSTAPASRKCYCYVMTPKTHNSLRLALPGTGNSRPSMM